MTTLTRLLAVLSAFAVPTAAFAQPPAPPPPAKYKVSVRYYIPAPRDQHVMQYDSLIRHLQSLQFEFDPPLDKHAETDREDRSKNYLHGFIAPGKALKLLDHRVAQTLLLVPDGFDLPNDPDASVLVRLELAGNLPPDRQRELANQTHVLLRELGFKEPVGYDHRGYSGRFYTRIVGTVPRGKLDILQRDLRGHPAGWLGPVIKRDELPLPLRGVNPVSVIEVLPDTTAIKEVADPAARLPDFTDKISADLWTEIVKDKDTPATPVRVQIAFVGNISPDDRGWKKSLGDLAPGFFVESQLGQFVTGIAQLDQIKAFASSPNISTIRLPRVPHVNVDPAIKPKGDNQTALAQTGLNIYHVRGHQGKGVRIGIIDRDFRGWETLVKNKQLSPRTRLVDLTNEMDPDILPLKYADDKTEFGHGTLCAQAAAIAAPQAEMVLIRVDVGDPAQLYEIVRYTQGGRMSNTIERRNGELVARTAQLTARRSDSLKERAVILNDFTDETDLRDHLEFLGPLFAWIYSDREWHRQRMQHHERLEEEQRLREVRLRAFLKEVGTLEGIPILVNAVAFQHGYPLGAASPLSKMLDDPARGPLWFQSVGNVQGQSWAGLFRHTPGDPALKFAPLDVALPKARWSREINFLGWQPYQDKPAAELPEKTKLRITMQWRESHDADYFDRGEGEENIDYYRKPLAEMRVHLVRQRDPETKTLPADLFEIVARTSGLPERIEHLPTGSTYEQVLEVTLDKAGRYAIRVEKQTDTQWVMGQNPERNAPIFELLKGLAPTGIRPLGVPTLPALEKNGELRPRIFVEVIDELTRLQGRAVFVDFPTETGVIGSPADARNVISVGAASLKNQPQPYSAFGSPLQMELARRPWVYGYDELELAAGGAFGTSIANAFAAGAAATLQSAGATRPQLLLWLRSQEGKVVRVPVAKK